MGSPPRTGSGSRTRSRTRTGSSRGSEVSEVGGRSPSRGEGSPSPLDRAKSLALRVLSFHARSTAQLRARLVRAGLEAHADEVLAWAAHLGYLDDRAYARARARALLSAGRAGPRRAELELLRAGLAAPDALSAVADALAERAAELPGGEPPELAMCRVAAARRLRGADPSALDERARARLARWLLARGFSGGTVARVVGLSADVDLA
jgi:regulatory protein